MDDVQHPDEPSWAHRTGDPEHWERWWTGIEWSEYTREVGAELGAGKQLGATEGVAVGGPPLSENELGTQQSGGAAGDTASVGHEAAPDPATADPVPAPSGPFAFPAYQGDVDAGSGAVGGIVDRLSGHGDENETGWDRNLATMAWIPLLSIMVVFAYLVAGAQMSRHTRSHISGSINFGLSTLVMSAGVSSLYYVGVADTALAVIWLFALAAGFAGVVYLLTSIQSEDPAFAYWIWFGIWLLLAVLVATSSVGAVLFGVFFWLATIALIIANAVRGRLGMPARFFGFPVLPVLSRR